MNNYTPRIELIDEPDTFLDKAYEFFKLKPYLAPVAFVAIVLLAAGLINLAYLIF